MGACFSRIEVIAVTELQNVLIPALKEECIKEMRAIVIPEMLKRLNETSEMLDKMQKENVTN
jgi:hypothetical protein